MLGYVLLAIFVWIMYNFVVRFVLPVYNTTQQLKRQFNDIKAQQQQPAQPSQSPNSANNPKKEALEGEYIEFEEVK